MESKRKRCSKSIVLWIVIATILSSSSHNVVNALNISHYRFVYAMPRNLKNDLKIGELKPPSSNPPKSYERKLFSSSAFSPSASASQSSSSSSPAWTWPPWPNHIPRYPIDSDSTQKKGEFTNVQTDNSMDNSTTGRNESALELTTTPTAPTRSTTLTYPSKYRFTIYTTKKGQRPLHLMPGSQMSGPWQWSPHQWKEWWKWIKDGTKDIDANGNLITKKPKVKKATSDDDTTTVIYKLDGIITCYSCFSCDHTVGGTSTINCPNGFGCWKLRWGKEEGKSLRGCMPACVNLKPRWSCCYYDKCNKAVSTSPKTLTILSITSFITSLFVCSRAAGGTL